MSIVYSASNTEHSRPQGAQAAFSAQNFYVLKNYSTSDWKCWQEYIKQF